MVFVLIYYPTIASLVWFVVLCYTLHHSFRAESERRSVVYRRKGLFHIAAWLTPLVMTVLCIAIQVVCYAFVLSSLHACKIGSTV